MSKIKFTLFLSALTLSFWVSAQEKEGKFLLKERIVIDNLGEGNKDIKLWLPYPKNDNYQKVNFSSLNLKGVVFVKDKKYHNLIQYIHYPHYNKGRLIMERKFIITRKEYNSFISPSREGVKALFLKPTKRVVITKEIKNLAQEITKNYSHPQDKAKAVYDYIRENFTYSKDDPLICGIGDTRVGLKYKKGICTDYHSVFLSLMRSLGVPAKFEIGYPLTKDGEIKGYHCWAKFFIKGKGWFAVDISEADKHPEKKDYFFGHLDETRVHFTTGRDIYLPFAEDKGSQPLNYFIFPYIEVNHKAFVHFKRKLLSKRITEDKRLAVQKRQ